jgi:hypothetical protein
MTEIGRLAESLSMLRCDNEFFPSGFFVSCPKAFLLDGRRPVLIPSVRHIMTAS